MSNLVNSPITRPATSTQRTFSAHLGDIFNVKDFGALGNWNGSTGHDDTTSIQAALNAALSNNGGTVYFPTGRYHITSRLTAFGISAALTLLGDGASCAHNTGSIIEGNFADYLLYTDRTVLTVKLIRGLGFRNTNGTIPTGYDPQNSPDVRTTIINTQAGTSGRVRLNVNQNAHTFGPVSAVYTAGSSLVVAGVSGGTPGVNGIWTVSANDAGGFAAPQPWIEIPITHTAVGTGGTAALNGDGCGCLYYTGQGSTIDLCDFMWGDPVAGTGGTALVILPFVNQVSRSNFTGPWRSGIASNTSYGITGRRWHADGCLFQNIGIAVNQHVHSGLLDFSIIKNCGIGIRPGQKILSYIEEEQGMQFPGNSSGGTWQLNCCVMEDMAEYFILYGNSQGSMIASTMRSTGAIGNANSGIAGATAQMNGCIVSCSSITGMFTNAAVNFQIGGACYFATFEMTEVAVTGGLGQNFKFITAFAGTAFPSTFRNCPGEDGGRPYSILSAGIPPGTSGVSTNYSVIVTDGTDPTWTGTASNAGKTQVGFGTNRVMTRYDGSAWITTG